MHTRNLARLQLGEILRSWSGHDFGQAGADNEHIAEAELDALVPGNDLDLFDSDAVAV